MIVIGLLIPHPELPSAVEFDPVTAIARVVPFAPPATFTGTDTDAVPELFHEYVAQDSAFWFTMFPSSASSCSTQYCGGYVGVRVNVRVGVYDGGGLVSSRHTSSTKNCTDDVVVEFVWNTSPVNCEIALFSANTGPHPPCVNCAFVTSTCVHAVVAVKLKPQ